MCNRKYYLLFSMATFVCIHSFSQIKRGEYCACIKAPSLIDKTKNYPDSVYATYQEDTTGIVLSIINTTMDTLYIFKSYIDKDLLSSKYLHRINTKEKKYKLSLLPIVSNVFTKYSDVITDEPIVGNQQVVYDFIKMPPNSTAIILFGYKDLFKRKDSQNNVSKDYDIRTLHKYTKKVPQKFCTVSKLKGNYKFEIEFAVFKSVSLLCNEASYFLQESEFEKQSKDFKILTVPVDTRNYDY